MESSKFSEPASTPPRVLRGKTILLISPQPWDHVFISKHHYAEELARENTVYFLEPPRNDGARNIVFKPVAGRPGLTVVSWRPAFPRRLRFHAYGLYRWLIAAEARRIVRKIGGAVDVVWSFDFNLFPDLRAFGSQLVIFHPVDPLSSSRQVDIGKSADLIISVSDRILGNFLNTPHRQKTLLVNHGLAATFAHLADEPAQTNPIGKRRVGFFGNLDRGVLNIPLLLRLAQQHADVMFEFWGPYTEGSRFHRALGGLTNVRLHGSTSKEMLAQDVQAVDCFVLPYIADPIESDRSNSHKMLEYMSTGKITLACPMDCYRDRPDLVKMPDSDDDDAFVRLFSETIDDIQTLNAPHLVACRKAFAKQYTYAGNLRAIDHRLSAILAQR